MKIIQYKKYAFILLCVAYGSVFAIALINVVVDPFYIFRTPFLNVQTQVNDRYDKIEFLKNNKGRFNIYLMGTSRMFLTSPELIEKYIPGGKGYNLGIILANMNEYLLHVKYFIDQGYPVKVIYLELDLDRFFGVKTHREQDSLLKLHPEVTHTNLIEFYWSYLSILPKGDIRRKLKANFGHRPVLKTRPGKDGALAPELQAQNAPIFFEDRRILENFVIRNSVGRENLVFLKEMVALCKQNDIRLILFTTPHHRMIMDHFVEEEYLSFLKELSEVTPFWNFSGYNSVTTENKYYLDYSHFKPSVSRLIAARIFDDSTMAVPKDFGFFVTRENVDSDIEKEKISFKKNSKQQDNSRKDLSPRL